MCSNPSIERTPMPTSKHAVHTAARSALVAAFVLVPLTVCGQSVEEALQDIRATYDFEPSKMSFDEQARRAPTLSALWSRYARKPETYGPALRTALRTSDGRELMYCDGGMLLLAKQTAPDDQALGLKSLERCSLAEIQHTPYFYTLNALAARGMDTINLQFRILEKPKYSVFIVQHALTLGQDYAFLYPLLIQDEQTYVARIDNRLQAEQEPTAQKSLVRALWYSATAEAENALRTFVASPAASSLAKDDARRLLERTDAERKWPTSNATLKRVLANLGLKNEPAEAELRTKRRARMRSISDEALHDLEAYTTLIYRARRGT